MVPLIRSATLRGLQTIPNLVYQLWLCVLERIEFRLSLLLSLSKYQVCDLTLALFTLYLSGIAGLLSIFATQSLVGWSIIAARSCDYQSCAFSLVQLT